FFKQKTAYEIFTGLEFRRVLFRSLRYAPRRRAHRRLRGRHLHRAARPLPARRDRSGTGPALRGHRHHEEGSHIRSDLANAIEARSEEHTSELQSRENLVCRLLLEK